MEKIVNYIKLSFDELLNKVTWPTWKELQSSATLVIVASIIFALVVSAMDQTFSFVLEKVYQALGN